jgi:hypothetical protein
MMILFLVRVCVVIVLIDLLTRHTRVLRKKLYLPCRVSMQCLLSKMSCTDTCVSTRGLSLYPEQRANEIYACQNAVELQGGIPAQRSSGGPQDRYRLAQNRNHSVASPKTGDPETEKHMAEQKNVMESQEQRWQPLGDGRWGRVVGREGAER